MSTPTLALSCGHPPTPTEGFGTGVGRLPDGRTLCYACCDEHAMNALLDRSKPFVAYVSNDGRTVTTWTGGHLGRIVQALPCKLSRRSWTHSDSSYRSLRVIDVHGNAWYGRGSPGISIVLRACKGDR